VAAGMTAAVQLAGERVPVPARASASLGAGAALLMARPETIALRTPEPGDEGAMAAVVLRRQYLGEKTSYRVQLRGGEELQVDRHGPAHDAHRPGDAVVLDFDAAATRVLAR
jgi:iron(III) transport system ATP-binding protein